MIAETVATLKVRRERLGLSAEAVAAALEVSRATLWKWEAGRPGTKIRKAMLREWERIITNAESRARKETA